jgi:hypothetical protein
VITLLGALPSDEYRVALVLHPNVWSWYGEFQIESLWLDRARDAGLLLLPPDNGWKAALISADLVIGDQGSVTLYAAALDKPVRYSSVKLGSTWTPSVITLKVSGTPLPATGPPRDPDHARPRMLQYTYLFADSAARAALESSAGDFRSRESASPAAGEMPARWARP